MVTTNKTTRRDRLRLFLNGMKLHLTAFPTITIGGVAHPVATIMTEIDADIAASDQADKAHAAWIQQVDAERASHAALDPIVSGVKQFVRLQFGNTEAAQATLGDFGMTPHKKRVATPAVKVAAAAKADATRKARGTKGRKQKLTIKAAPATAPAPAPAPASATAPATGK